MIMEFRVIAVPLKHKQYRGMKIYTNEVKLSGLYSLQFYQNFRKKLRKRFRKKTQKMF